MISFQLPLQHLLQTIIYTGIFKYNTNILVILTHPDEAWDQQKEILLKLDNWRIHNIALIDESHFNEASFITYHRYRPPGEERFQIIQQPSNLSQLFPDKAKNLNGNPLHIFQFDDFPYNRLNSRGEVIGVNTFLFPLLAEKLNATINMTIFWVYSEYGNGIFSYHNGADLLLQMFSLQSFEFPETQFSYPYSVDDICVMVLRKRATVFSVLHSIWNNSSWWFLLAVAGDLIGSFSSFLMRIHCSDLCDLLDDQWQLGRLHRSH